LRTAFIGIGIEKTQTANPVEPVKIDDLGGAVVSSTALALSARLFPEAAQQQQLRLATGYLHPIRLKTVSLSPMLAIT
jgi:hypothetical protein